MHACRYTGHFTALIWKGAKVIGCAISNNKRIIACRYGGGPGSRLGPSTPNMRGLYPTNVFSKSRSESQCANNAAGPAPAGGGATPPQPPPPPPATRPPPPPPRPPPPPPPSQPAPAGGGGGGGGLNCHASGGLSSAEMCEMLKLTNKYRCMHGAPQLTWNDALAAERGHVFF